MIDLRAVIARYGIEPKGVVHVGAFLGSENPHYIEMGFNNILFLEAQDDTFAKLKSNIEGTNSFCENVAASDRNGKTTFHVLSNDMSSSILPVKKHLEVYDWCTETRTIEVETVRLDDLLAKDKYKDLDFNFINVDVQGAEKLVLAGAMQLLPKLDFMNLEVNFDELYESAPHIRDLDNLLAAYDFIRADTLVVHGTWGDAIWVKNKFTKAKRT